MTSRRILVVLLLPTALRAQDWPSYGGDPGGSRYSSLAQIARDNVGRLAVAWRFSTGEARPDFATRRRTSLEVTPLVVDGTMYVSTPLGRVFALDAATGRERWRYDPRVDRTANFGDFTNRGVALWIDRRARPGRMCRRRVVLAAIDGRLIALDASTGVLCRGFGDGGTVNLRHGLRNAPREPAEYEVTSPPAVVGDVLVVGSAVADNTRTDMASGEVRGYDARTGNLKWTFDPVPQDARDPAYATWRAAAGVHDGDVIAHRTGAANAWSVIVVDTTRGLVFVPTSSPSPDYFGGLRLGDNRHANSVVALRAVTGAVVWSFQTVHHDLWDYDNASPPALVTVRRDGRRVDAVLQATKTGMLFVLNRETGQPIVRVEERPVPNSDVPGEVASPTQPFSRIILSPHSIRPEDAFGADSADRVACRSAIASLRNEGVFTPPSVRGTLALPSNIGGAHWGGVAFDPLRQLAVVPVNTAAAVAQLLPRDSLGEEARRGHTKDGWEYAPMHGTPFVIRRALLLSPKGVPCTPPPFGALVAVNVETDAVVWRVPLGTPGALAGRLAPSRGPDADSASQRQRSSAMGYPDSVLHADSVALRALGSPNFGGPIITAGGVIFIGGTLDRRFRALDVETGQELWNASLPAGAKATPMTYMVRGRQYVAIAAGGDGDVFGKGDEIVVFALPMSPSR